MFSRTAIASAFVASTLAAPNVSPILRRQGIDGCSAHAVSGDACFYGDITYYSDNDCTQEIGFKCTYSGGGDGPACSTLPDPGVGICQSGTGFPDQAPFYAKLSGAVTENTQAIFTMDQTCPPQGNNGVFAALTQNGRCVEINLGGSGPGLIVYPNGGSGLAKRFFNETLDRRDDTKCSGFNTDSSANTETPSVKVSDIVDCTNGSESGCSITKGQQQEQSITTSYSLTAGGGIEGIFEASATFGMDYTDSETTSIQETYSVQQGQKGYLSAYSSATVFTGSFTGCDQGDATQAGKTVAVKAGTISYLVINTSG